MEERIVNRVHPGPHVQAEANKLKGFDEAPTVDHQPVYDVSTGKFISREEFKLLETEEGHLFVENSTILVPQTAEAQRAGQIGSIEESDNVGNLIDKTIPNLTQYLKNPIVKVLLEEKNLKVDEFEVFRMQVIAAFRHLGLDSRKFFGV